LKKELDAILKEPPPNARALPNPDNILEWHYVIFGPKESPYEGGVYHGKLKFPPEYPFKPPSILMYTPSGRFKPNTRLCFSMSDFHPETWNPMWSVSSILTGLLSFMLSDEQNYGSMTSTVAEKQTFAKYSVEHNKTNAMFKSLFPDLAGLEPTYEETDAAPNQPPTELANPDVAPTESKSIGGTLEPEPPKSESVKKQDPVQSKPTSTSPKPQSNQQQQPQQVLTPTVWGLIVLLLALVIALIAMYSSE
jgi:ubiquitin-conjugating enzyme E2 J2